MRHPTCLPVAVPGWVAGVTGESTRDTVQRALIGRRGYGGGALRQHDVVSRRLARGGAPGLFDTIRVRHVSGGTSTIAFKSYEKGREKWQGETLHRVWFDEEPPHDIYSEGLTRTNATGGMVMLTMTPLLGMSEVVRSFLENPTPDRHVTQMTIDDAAHYTAEERARIIAAYPPHEREARARGIPVLGSGRIFRRIHIEKRIDWLIRPVGNRDTVPRGPNLDLAQIILGQRFAQIFAQRQRPQAHHRVAPFA